MEKLEEMLEWGGVKKDIACLVVSGISLVLSFAKVDMGLPFDIAWVSIILCGIPIVMEAIIGLVTRFDIKADVLVSLALIASVCIHENFAAGEVAFIMQLGALLEDLTVAKARAGIEKLIQLTPTTARIVDNKDGKETEEIIEAKQVCVGNTLRVLAGETVPVDGVILSGQTSINQASLTGESIPVDKTVDDEVYSGTVNLYGTFDMRATKVGEDSSIQKMIRLVQSADAGKAKIVGLADRWATWVVVVALLASVSCFVVTREIIRAVTILIVFCPCSLVLATPTAIIAAMGNVTKHGILVREGDAMERLASVQKITFDKTGTLTYGAPTVTDVVSLEKTLSTEKLFQIVASAETRSEHPLGKAIVKSFKETGKDLLTVEEFKLIAGQGIIAKFGEDTIYAGNEKLMKAAQIDCSELLKISNRYLEQGCTAILVGSADKPMGVVVLSDTVRENAKDVIGRLKACNVTPVLLTGDNEMAAKNVAATLGITEVKANCLPEDKLKQIDAFEANREPVCMIGDGINDAPALKKARAGIAMGGIGSDIAVEAADIALVNDDIRELPHLLALSKKMMRTIKFNLSFSMGLNVLAIILATTGVLNPVIGALVHNCGSVFVIVNSAFLMEWEEQQS